MECSGNDADSWNEIKLCSSVLILTTLLKVRVSEPSVRLREKVSSTGLVVSAMTVVACLALAAVIGLKVLLGVAKSSAADAVAVMYVLSTLVAKLSFSCRRNITSGEMVMGTIRAAPMPTDDVAVRPSLSEPFAFRIVMCSG